SFVSANSATTLSGSPLSSSACASSGATCSGEAPLRLARRSSFSALVGSPTARETWPSNKRASALSGCFCTAFFSWMIAACVSPRAWYSRADRMRSAGVSFWHPAVTRSTRQSTEKTPHGRGRGDIDVFQRMKCSLRFLFSHAEAIQQVVECRGAGVEKGGGGGPDFLWGGGWQQATAGAA